MTLPKDQTQVLVEAKAIFSKIPKACTGQQYKIEHMYLVAKGKRAQNCALLVNENNADIINPRKNKNSRNQPHTSERSLVHKDLGRDKLEGSKEKEENKDVPQRSHQFVVADKSLLRSRGISLDP